MSYAKRRRQTTARALAMSDPDQAIAAAWQRDPWLAIDMAEVVNHVPTLLRALASGVPAWQLRAAGSSSLPHFDPAELAHLVPDLPAAVRRTLYRGIRSKRLTALADGLLEPVLAAWGADEAARLLPTCGRRVVETWLATIGHGTSVAANHPGLVLDRAFAELAGLSPAVWETWWQRNAAEVEAVTPHDPGRVLDLVERFGPQEWFPVSSRHSWVLARTDPARFARLLVGRRHELSKRAYRLLAAANPPDLVELGKVSPVKVLSALPPARRAEFFDRVHQDQDMARADLPEDVLRLLPRARRAAEARRMLAIAAEKADEARIRRLTAFLPFDEARGALTAVTRSGVATERAEGFSLLVECAATHSRLAELLPGLADRLRREQDPVRLAAVQALARVSPRALSTTDGLAQIAGDAADSRDFSHGTGQALAKLCLRLYAHNGATEALDPLRSWWHRTGWGYLGRLDLVLRRGQEHAVYEVLRDAVESAADRAEFSPLLAAVRAFGKRAWHMPALQEPLWLAVAFAREFEARQAISLLLADPRARDDRLERVLDVEPSAIYLSEVLLFVTSRRTDLLDRLLADEPPRGRFAPGPARQVPLWLTGNLRWTAEQRGRFAILVKAIADDTGQDRATRAAAVAALGRVHGPAKLEARRYLGSEDELLAQAAVGVLPDSDDPVDALSLLLSFATAENRGQTELVSMYTVRRCADLVRPSALIGPLSAALAAPGRVTVRKELVRLLSHFRVPGAVDALTRTFHAEGQHRDVRAACAFAALSWLDNPAAWDLLRAAVTDDREVATQVLRVTPWSAPVQHRPGLAALIAGVAGGDDNQLRQNALAALGTWVEWYPDALRVLSGAVTDLTQRAAWRAAAHGLVSRIQSADGEAALLSAMHTLAGVTGPDAAADRDRPALRRLQLMLRHLTTRSNVLAGKIRDVVLRVVEEMRPYDEIRPDVATLRATAVRLGSPDVLADLTAVAELVAGRPVLAVRAGRQVADLLKRARPWNPEALLAALAEVPDGHIAVTVTATAGEQLGWPEPWRDLVRTLRRHHDPDVRYAALAITVVGE